MQFMQSAHANTCRCSRSFGWMDGREMKCDVNHVIIIIVAAAQGARGCSCGVAITVDLLTIPYSQSVTVYVK